MNQRKRNLRLIIVLAVLLLATTAVYFSGGNSDRLSIDKALFAYDQTDDIDRVVISHGGEKNELTFTGGQWVLNGKYEADPQRVSVLFAILKQNRVRRKVSNRAKSDVDSLFTANTTEVSFFSAGDQVKSFEVAGDPDRFLSYVRSADDIYIVEIPGYRTYLAGLFALDENGWRDPLVFDLNWTNLKKMSMVYPEQENDQFDVIFNNRFYKVDQLDETDSLKLMNYMDDISLLYVNDYLLEKEVSELEGALLRPQASVIVEDIGQNFYTVEFFEQLPQTGEIVGRIDSSEYALFDYERVRKMLRPKGYFVPSSPSN